MSIEKKAKMFAALSLFQITTSVASAATFHMRAENPQTGESATCDIAMLNREEVLSPNKWISAVMDEELSRKSSNDALVRKIDKKFVEGGYFDQYPHKLAEIFKAGACTLTIKK